MAWPKTQLADVLIPVSREERVDASREYRLLGVRLDGQGPFLRETVLGTKTSASKLYRVAAGDFIYSRLFAWRGAFGVIEPELDGCYVSGEFPTFAPKPDKIDVRFLRYWFRLSDTLSKVTEDCSGSTPLTRNRFKEQFFLALQIPLPPLAEQWCIVARIEALAAKITGARSLRQQAAEEAKILLRSKLNSFLALTKADGIPFRQIGSFTQFDRYGPRFYDQPYDDNGTPIVRATDIDDHGRIDFSAMPRLQVSADEVARLRVEVGDLLVVRSGSIGLSAVFDRTDIDCIPAAYLIQFRFDGSAQPQYVRYCLQAPEIQQELTGRGTTVQNLNARKIKSTEIPFPPLSEQRHIVAYLDSLQAKVDTLSHLQSETAAELDAMLPAILDRAFKGEL